MQSDFFKSLVMLGYKVMAIEVVSIGSKHRIPPPFECDDIGEEVKLWLTLQKLNNKREEFLKK